MITQNKHTDPSKCMKCGFCMSVCPVYRVDYRENHVARGRNLMIRTSREDHANVDQSYRDVLENCLLCRQCETVCPAKLSSAEITQQERLRVFKKKKTFWLRQRLLQGLRQHGSSSSTIVRLSAILPSMVSMDHHCLNQMKNATMIMKNFTSWSSLLARSLSKSTVQFPKCHQKTTHTAFFPGCVFGSLHGGIGAHIHKLLFNLKLDVSVPCEATCCGQAFYAIGDQKNARWMARRNIQALESYDRVISPCATCSSGLKNYPSWLDVNDPLYPKARQLAQKTLDFTEFLSSSDKIRPARYKPGMKITYHDPCHLKRYQNIYKEPRRLLAGLDWIKYIEMDNADTCCGFGGSFAIKQSKTSRAILNKKIEAIRKTEADAVITACPGCMINLKIGLRRHKLPIRVLHIGELVKTD